MSPGWRQAIVAVGSNLGDRAGVIRNGLESLGLTSGVRLLTSSAWYETEPVGLTEQPPFINLVIGFETTLSPEDLLSRLHAIEADNGRTREEEVRWGPRSLDLDLLLFEGEARAGPGLVLPHPRMWERAFVTIPLRDLLNRPEFGRAWAEVRGRLESSPDPSGVKPWTE